MFLDEQDGCCFPRIWVLLYHFRLNLNQVLLHNSENLAVAPGVRFQRGVRKCQNQ